MTELNQQELTKLCTRIATKVLGWKLDTECSPDFGYPVFHSTDMRAVLGSNDLDYKTYDFLELASPWGRDLVEQAAFPQGFIVEIHYSKSKHLGGWVCEIGIAKGRSGWRTFYRSDIAADDLNLACLLTADKAVSDG